MISFDPKYVSALVIIAVAIGKLAGIEIISADMTKWIESLVYVVGGIIVAVKTFKEGKISIFGAIKS